MSVLLVFLPFNLLDSLAFAESWNFVELCWLAIIKLVFFRNNELLISVIFFPWFLPIGYILMSCWDNFYSDSFLLREKVSDNRFNVSLSEVCIFKKFSFSFKFFWFFLATGFVVFYYSLQKVGILIKKNWLEKCKVLFWNTCILISVFFFMVPRNWVCFDDFLSVCLNL